MRRTLTVAALAAAMLVPAAAASADPGTNASCSNGKGGNTHGSYSGHGNVLKAAKLCGPEKPADKPDVPVDQPKVPEVPDDTAESG